MAAPVRTNYVFDDSYHNKYQSNSDETNQLLASIVTCSFKMNSQIPEINNTSKRKVYRKSTSETLSREAKIALQILFRRCNRSLEATKKHFPGMAEGVFSKLFNSATIGTLTYIDKLATILLAQENKRDYSYIGEKLLSKSAITLRNFTKNTLKSKFTKKTTR
jgi:hypothetical protein